jgi:hypothetical protein
LGEPDRESLAAIVADSRRDVPANRRISKAVRKIGDAVQRLVVSPVRVIYLDEQGSRGGLTLKLIPDDDEPPTLARALPLAWSSVAAPQIVYDGEEGLQRDRLRAWVA